MKPRAVVGLVSLLTAALGACSSSSSTSAPADASTGGSFTQEDAIRVAMTAYCTRFQQCDPSLFNTSYASVSACVDSAVAYQKARHDVSVASSCTKEVIGACAADIDAESCAATKGALPTSCSGCGLNP